MFLTMWTSDGSYKDRARILLLNCDGGVAEAVPLLQLEISLMQQGCSAQRGFPAASLQLALGLVGRLGHRYFF